MAIFFKLVCSSSSIRILALLKFFVMRVCRKSLLSEGLERDYLIHATIAKLLDPCSQVVLMNA